MWINTKSSERGPVYGELKDLVIFEMSRHNVFTNDRQGSRLYHIASEFNEKENIARSHSRVDQSSSLYIKQLGTEEIKAAT